MELKKIFIFFLFINFASNLNAEILKPDNKFTPYDVVKIQLNALRLGYKTSMVICTSRK